MEEHTGLTRTHGRQLFLHDFRFEKLEGSRRAGHGYRTFSCWRLFLVGFPSCGALSLSVLLPLFSIYSRLNISAPAATRRCRFLSLEELEHIPPIRTIYLTHSCFSASLLSTFSARSLCPAVTSWFSPSAWAPSCVGIRAALCAASARSSWWTSSTSSGTGTSTAVGTMPKPRSHAAPPAMR